MIQSAIVSAVLTLSGVPALLFVVNLFAYRRVRLQSRSRGTTSGISVLIPARNEEENLEGTLRSVCANKISNSEILVLDDHSTDRTAELVEKWARSDPRVRLVQSPPLPSGWCGKQHACYMLSKTARFPLLLFLDADVRLSSDALERMVGFMASDRADLVSGVPKQILKTFSERLLLPFIHFLLLGFLPIFGMRRTRKVGFGAGCGQLMLVRAAAYHASGGHAAIRDSLHDGLKLPRLFRRSGFRTELIDATDLATCRMYSTNGQVWNGLGKNATEGMAAGGVLAPMTMLLLGGQVAPFVLLGWMGMNGDRGSILAALAVFFSYLPRWLGAIRFRQPFLSSLLHPVGVLCLLYVQWSAWLRKSSGKPSQWRGRSYSLGTPVAPAASRTT